MKINYRVSINSDPKIVRSLWHATGRITKTRRDIEHHWKTNQITLNEERFFVEFDQPQNSIGSKMIGLWVRENQVSRIGN